MFAGEAARGLASRIAVLGTCSVLAHAVVVLLHGLAHAELGVQLSISQKTFATIVIVAAPLVAAALLWTRQRRVGFLLLLGSMAGSLVFGVFYHFVFVSPDHVSHLPAGNGQALFRSTALLLPLSEAFGLIAGLSGVRTATAGVAA